MKKWLLVGLALVIVVVIGLYFSGSGGELRGETVGRIEVPEGNGIKIISRLPAELEIIWDWEETEVDEVFQLNLSGKVKDISEQYAANYDHLSFVLDGEEVAKCPNTGSRVYLNPGEEAKFYVGELIPYWVLQEAKSLEIKAIDFQKEVVLSVSTEKFSAEPVKEQVGESKQSIFTSVPKNPKSPDEIVAAFYFFASEGKHAQSSKYTIDLTPEVLERDAGQFFRSRKLERIELEYSIKENGKEGICDVTFYFTDGTTDETRLSLVKNGGWKLE